MLQRPREGVASFGFLQRLETEADAVGHRWIVGMMLDKGVAEVGGAEKLDRRYVRTRVDIPMLREKNEALLSVLDDKVSEIILAVRGLLQLQKRLD